MSDNDIKLDDIFKAAKAFKNEIPALKAHTVRIRFCGSFYRVVYEKVNERGNLVSFEIHVPNYVV